MLLQITDGLNTVELSGTSPVLGCTYVPKAGENPDERVSETATVVLRGTATTIRAVTRAIELLFQAARERNETGAGPRVYAEYAPLSGDPTNRCELYNGKVVWSENAKRRILNSGTTTVEVAVIWERFYAWDGPEAEAPLSSDASPSYATGGKTIHNHDDSDSGHGNHVQIAGAVIGGTEPTPARIQMTNNVGSSQTYANFYIANNVKSDPQSFVQMIEGEDRQVTYGSVTSDSGSSGGEYVSVTVNTTGTLAWDLSAATMIDCGGRYFRLLARLVNTPANPIYVTPEIRDSSGLVTLAKGLEVKINNISQPLLVDLGALPIPPGGADIDGWAGTVLWLSLRSEASATFALDYIQLTPTESLRHLVQRGMAVANGGAVVDDSMLGVAYHLAGSAKHAIHVQLGQPVMLWPNEVNKIYILHDIATGSSPIANTLSVRVFYRPRRATL